MSLTLINTENLTSKAGIVMKRPQALEDRYCPICNKTFVLKIHLVVHLRNHHNNPVNGNGALVLLPQNTDASNGAAETSCLLPPPSLPPVLPAAVDKPMDYDVNHPATEESGLRNGEKTTIESSDINEKFRLSSGASADLPLHGHNGTPVSATQKGNTGDECSSTRIIVEPISNNQDPGESENNNDSSILRAEFALTPKVPPGQERDERLDAKKETRNRRMVEVPQRQRINKVWGFAYNRTSTPGPDRWTCIVCNKGLNTFSSLALHLRKNHGSNMAIIDGGGQPRGPLVHSPMIVRQEGRSRLKPWTCRKCGKNFMRHQLLWKHRINFCGLGSKYKCPCCPAEFKQKFMLYEHRMKHNSRGKLKLKVSKPNFDWRKNGFGPIRLSLDSLSNSSGRAGTTVAASSTNGHSNEKKPPTKTGKLQCHISGCNMVLRTSTELNDHVRVKHHVYPCGECGSVLTSRLDFDLHYMKRHNTVSSNQHKKISLTPVVKVEHPRLERSEGNEKVAVAIPKSALAGPRKPTFRVKPSHMETTPSPASKIIIKVLFCAECNQRFPNIREYLAHQKLHKDVKSANRKPPSVNTGTATAGASNNARPVTATGNPVQNISNGKRTTTVIGPNGESVVIKTEREEEPPLHTCAECHQTFRTDRSYRRHRDQSLCKIIDHPYACKQCDQSFTREASLKNHINSQHEPPEADSEDEGSVSPATDAPGRRCGVCGKIFKTIQDLREHNDRMHDRKPVNGKTSQAFAAPVPRAPRKGHGTSKVGRYSSSPSSPVPMETSTEHLCNECRKTFVGRRELAEHLLWHNALKNSKQVFRGVRDPVSPLVLEGSPPPLDHKCAICGGGFHRREDMLTHVRYAHSRKGAYGCTDCKRVFHDAIALIEHQGIHKKATPDQKRTKLMEEPTVLRMDKNASFPCIYCGSKFPALSRLHEHRKIMHPTEKSLICPYPNCCIPYVHEMGLKRHMRDHKL